jgi:hypothetical protein
MHYFKVISSLEQYPFMERNVINTIVVLVIIIIHNQCYLPLGGAPGGGPDSD